MGWLYLITAGLAEVGFVFLLKKSEGFSKTGPTLGFIAVSMLSFWLLTRAMQTIPLGTAYGVWTGIGTLGAAIVGIIIFKDPFTLAKAFFIGLLLISIIGLKMVTEQ